MGKREAAEARGLGEAGATWSGGGEADKAELPGNGRQGRQHSRCRSREAESRCGGCSLRLRFSRNRPNKTLSRKTEQHRSCLRVQVGRMTFQGVFLQIPVLQDYVGHVQAHMPVTW